MTTHPPLALGPDGHIVIPAEIRDSLGIPHGGALIGRLEDGVLSIETVDAAISLAQAAVRQCVPGGVSLVHELLAERRAAAESE